MSSSVHIYNMKISTLILGNGLTYGLGLDHTKLMLEPKYSINFSRSKKRFCLLYIIMGTTVFYFLMPQKYINSKQNLLK